VWPLFHQWWEAFLANPQATFSAWIGFASTALGIYLQHIKRRNDATVRRMESEPPSPGMDTFKREVTGKHAALDERLDQLERSIRVAHEDWTNAELRKRLSEVGEDHAKTASALVVERENVAALAKTIDARNLRIQGLLAQRQTLQNALEERDAELGRQLAAMAALERERDDCEGRCLYLKDKLRERSTQPHSVELALDDERLPTPLRPPALPPGRPKETR
jgi:chromosome segregation ATPase